MIPSSLLYASQSQLRPHPPDPPQKNIKPTSTRMRFMPLVLAAAPFPAPALPARRRAASSALMRDWIA